MACLDPVLGTPPGPPAGPGPRVWLVRHARTAASAAHRLNGQPRTPIDLDDVGHRQCAAARHLPQVGTADVCVVSAFRRARATAELLLAGRPVDVLVNARLNELDYGMFEGGPFWDYGTWLTRHGIHARPPGAAESQWQGLTRMAAALRKVLGLPGRPLVIGHGLLVSVLTHVIAGGSPADQVFPEAGYLAPVGVTAETVTALERGLADVGPDQAGADQAPTDQGWYGRPDRGTARAPVGVVTVEADPQRGGRAASLPP